MAPAKSTTAIAAADTLLRLIGFIGGPPDRIRSDNGTQYAATVIAELNTFLGMDHVFSIAYHPQSNGIVERSNLEVMRHLRA